jgi:hypothetical protein
MLCDLSIAKKCLLSILLTLWEYPWPTESRTPSPTIWSRRPRPRPCSRPKHVTVSFVQEIRSESPESHEKPSASCHCERSEAISWPIVGLLRRLRRLAM